MAHKFFTNEPYRETNCRYHITFYQPADEMCGEKEPRGKQLSTAFHTPKSEHMRLSPSEYQIWCDWAEKERLARSAILTTVAWPLLLEVQHDKLWSARDIYNALGAVLHGDLSSYARDDNLRHLQTMCLNEVRTKSLKEYFHSFKRLASSLMLTDQVKVDMFLRSLVNPTIRAETEEKWNSLPGDANRTWALFEIRCI